MQCRRGVLSLSSPIENGAVTNWDDMEKILHYILYKELRVNPDNHSVWHSVPLLSSLHNCGILAELTFEKFNMPSMYLNLQSVLSLYSAGLTTGCVFDSGDSLSRSSCIYEGYISNGDVRVIELAGREVTDYLMRLLSKRGYSFTTAFEREIVSDIKEKLTYIPADYEQELASSVPDVSYQLPDGQMVYLGRERISCPQALFQPSLIGMKSDGIHNLVYNNILNSELDCRREFYRNIVLAGGNTLYPGICERLRREISKLAPPSFKVNVIAPNNQKCSSWIGGSVLASLSGFPQFYSESLSKQVYAEYGAYAVKRKFCSI